MRSAASRKLTGDHSFNTWIKAKKSRARVIVEIILREDTRFGADRPVLQKRPRREPIFTDVCASSMDSAGHLPGRAIAKPYYHYSGPHSLIFTETSQ